MAETGSVSHLDVGRAGHDLSLEVRRINSSSERDKCDFGGFCLQPGDFRPVDRDMECHDFRAHDGISFLRFLPNDTAG
jgi:hypothetical protein